MKKKSRAPRRSSLLLPCILSLATGLVAVGIAVFVLPSRTQFCANSKSCINNLQATAENNTPGYFEGQQVIPPAVDLAEQPNPTKVLGAEDPQGEKHIFVDLSTQTLHAYQGTDEIMNTFVSTGKWNPTPPGDYKIWVKLRSTRMSGGEGADAYDLPNVPFTMFFYNDKVSKGQGYSIHGAYWHDNFGHMMSHGCVNMRSVDAEQLYNWASPTTISPTTYATAADPGTTVSICNQLQMQAGATPTCIQQ